MNCIMLGSRRDRSQGAPLDLQASSYLGTLAVVSTTFVGFAALLVGLRQAKGSHLTKYDAYFTLTFIQIGFLVTISALIPPLVALYGTRASVVWRVSSAITAIPLLWFLVSLPARRRAATGMPVPPIVKGLIVIQAIAAAGLLLDAVTTLEVAAALYATAMTIFLVCAGIAYLFALGIIRPEIAGPSD